MSEAIHPRELSLEDGIFLVKLARRAVEEKLISDITLKPPADTPRYMYRPGMVFTTIESYRPGGRSVLRGCIGFLSPIYSLIEATIKSALEAAFGDPRFPPVRKHELPNLVFEVTVLSMPINITREDRFSILKEIVIGRDGLIVEKGFYKGTLLPAVPVEYCWDVETFVSETCLKAGLEPDCWLKHGVEIYRYEGRVYREVKPYGDVVERDLVKEFIQACGKSLF
ncbi:MAG: TIGR00296 family protein [Desulfurococcaceae archaeon]|uniref:Protein ENU09_01860 n=1 Tax=Staphylothermus marinus TaxID=2280 RepID=A0A7C4NM69_STAMA